ncbi:MAG TPA: FecR domain-containing protein [bacterium]|nr:FecR domain-containing protein [bacterium]
MKKLQMLFAAALCGVVFNVSAQTGSSGYATVVRVTGSAYYSLGAGEAEHPLLAGKTLPAGATIRTEDNGIVDVVLGKSIQTPQAFSTPDRISQAADSPVRGMVGYKPSAEQNVVRLTPGTTLGIDKLTVTDTGADTVSDTELDLKKGKIFASVKKLSGASQYLIKLPNGIAGVRGTLFAISADGTVSVYESKGGGVVLSLVLPDGSTKTYLVAPGQYIDPATGKPGTLPPEAVNALSKVFTALQTLYLETVSFSFDGTHIYVSPTHGKGHGRGGGNSGNGGGNQ